MINFETAVYGITAQGRKIQIGKATKTIADAQRVGGAIFYVDSTGAGGTYEFYDEGGEVIPTESIVAGSTPYAYKVTGTVTKDKYYVFHDALFTSKQWTYQSGGSWVYESTGATNKNIGGGKTNTATVMALNEGAYYTQNVNSVWNVCHTANNASSPLNGCTDWFVPSKGEEEELRLRINDSTVSSTGIVTFNGKYIWSSSEGFFNNAWYWNSSYWDNNSKNNSNSCVLVRAF